MSAVLLLWSTNPWQAEDLSLPMPTWSWGLLQRYGHVATMSPHIHLFSKQRPHFLCLSPQHKYSKPHHPGGPLLTLFLFVNVYLALGWSKLGKRSSLTHAAKYRSAIAALEPLAVFLLIQPTASMAFYSARTDCWPMLSLLSAQNPKVFFSEATAQPVSLQALLMQGVRMFQIWDFPRKIAQILVFNLREQKPDKRQQTEINTRQHAAHIGSQDEEFNQLIFPNRL